MTRSPSYILKILFLSTHNVATAAVKYTVVDSNGTTVATASGTAGVATSITIAAAKTWSTAHPHLYDMHVELEGGDAVVTYFGLREIALGAAQDHSGDAASGVTRPLLNGNFTFFAGFLDQSWWPDGQYTAPTDEALAFDIEAVAMFGLNMIRLHQKVNPERWYYHADRLGVAIFQDMIQKFVVLGGETSATVPLFVSDLKKMIAQRGNHPAIIQWTTFNEGDCWSVFKTKPHDVAGMVDLTRNLSAPYGFRLVDTDSGGRANNLHIGDINDIHSYPSPGNPVPSATQYAMVGEFGGIGAFVAGKEWLPHGCFSYLKVDTPREEADAYIKMAATLESRVSTISASVYTQTTDVEKECDGYLNMDRSNKFSAADTERIKAANQAIIHASRSL